MKTRKHRAAKSGVKRRSLAGLIPVNLPPHGHLVHHKSIVNHGLYLNCEYETVLEFCHRERRFWLFTYAACADLRRANGIAILDIDSGQVVCDGICRHSSALGGATEEQKEQIQRFLRLTWENLKQFINHHPNHYQRI